MDAAAAGMAEVQAGQLAAQKAQSPQVKQFAQRMVEDHTAANGELMKLASARNLTPPAEPDRKHRAAIDKLGKQSGADFDRAYMKMQVADHEKTVALFEKQAKNGKGDELRQWASAKLPALREHLQMARSDMNGMGDQSRHGGSGAMPGGAAGSAHSGTGSSNTAGAGNAATPGGAGMPGNAMTGRPSGPSGGNASASGAK
jgi:putative membrane protein